MDPANTSTSAPAEQPAVVTGNLSGGWPYVWSAYGVTWLFLIGYAVSLILRRPRSGGTR